MCTLFAGLSVFSRHNSIMKLLLYLSLYAAISLTEAVSTKMDFGEEESTITKNTSTTEDEDVEVKHTIVVSTKLKNNNRRGITHDGDGTLSYNIGHSNKDKDDSGEVPVVKSFKSVETTQIRTPDSRYKTQIYPDAIFVNRNIRDETDVYPNVAVSPLNWKPSNFFNNINYWGQDNPRDPYNIARRRQNPNNVKIHRKISEDATREFYCKKCMEMSSGQGIRGCGVQQRSANSWGYETTTPKIKIDGKLAKLN